MTTPGRVKEGQGGPALLDSYFAVLENHSAKLGLSLGWQPWRLANRGLVGFSLY